MTQLWDDDAVTTSGMPAKGRRAVHKQATRATLAAAAQQLFAQRGYEATTVRDIADAAKVTERTFYRYFDGKEGLVAQEYVSWLADLKDAILDRPESEPALVAVRRAMIGVAEQARGAGTGLAAVWLFSKRPSPASVRQSAPRPLLRFEDAVAEAIWPRIAGANTPDNRTDPDINFASHVIARVAVAAFRSAMIGYRELLATDPAARGNPGELINSAFAIVSAQVGAASDSRWSDLARPREAD